jgi:putative exosortase-associated protein (TIGR04073 family)
MSVQANDVEDRATRRERGGLTRMRRAVLLGLGMLLLSDPALAQSQYTSARKVGRGFSNLTLGVLAIPGQMVQEIDRRGAAVGVPLGFGKGLGWFVATELVGVWEILTSPFEFPAGFRPILEPEFPWQYFE